MSGSVVLVSAPEAPVEVRLREALEVECVVSWLLRLRSITRRAYRNTFRDRLRWLWSQPGYEGQMPHELLDFQENTRGRQRGVIPDLMQNYVQAKGGTHTSMIVQLSRLRTFFTKNRVDLPPVGGWEPEPTHEPTQGKLTLAQVRQIILHANLRDSAIFLTMFQGMMDMERFDQFNRRCSSLLVDQLRTKDLGTPLRVDFVNGRKRNRRPYYTYLHHDALAAWQTHFERERGWSRTGEPLAVKKGTSGPPSKTSIRQSFDTVARKLHLKPKRGRDRGMRTGVGPHEVFRDVVRSHFQTARKQGFDTLCSEFWMGRRIDPYNYNKFATLEPEYVLENVNL